MSPESDERVSCSWADGGQYEGTMRDRQRHGSGKMTYANGDKYDGQWERDVHHGLGILMHAAIELHKYVYDGAWAHGLQHGKGSMLYKNGDILDGEWTEGVQPTGVVTPVNAMVQICSQNGDKNGAEKWLDLMMVMPVAVDEQSVLSVIEVCAAHRDIAAAKRWLEVMKSLFEAGRGKISAAGDKHTVRDYVFC